MKKLLLLPVLLLLFSCSNDGSGDSPVSTTPTTPVTPTTETLSGSVITPSSIILNGYGKGVQYVLTKNGAVLNNTKYNWSVSDTLHGRVSNDGNFISRIIGETQITVADGKGNTVSAFVKTEPKITNIPDIPFLKMGASYNEIKASVGAGWTLEYERYPYNELIYKKGNDAIHYRINAGSGLYSMHYIPNYNPYLAFLGGATDINIFVDYNSERFMEVSMTNSHYYGHKRWWYKNQYNQIIYVDIETDSGNRYWKLRFYYT